MSAETRPLDAGEPQRHLPAAPVALLAALTSETRPLQAAMLGTSHPPLTVATSGQGAARAARAALDALAQGAVGLVSWGLAGGLVSDLRSGDVLVPHTVCTPDGRRFATDAPWGAAIISELTRAPGGERAPDRRDMVAVDAVLTSAARKTAIAMATGAVAADMESVAIARVATDAGVPFVVVRVVVDEAGDELPESIGAWVDDSGRTRLAPVLSSLLWPGDWRRLLMIGGRFRQARATLTRLADTLVPRQFALPASFLH